jgi:hypothetical protein
MIENKQQTAVTSLIILIGVVILCIGMAKSQLILIGVMGLALLLFAYFCIYLTILRNKGNDKQ